MHEVRNENVFIGLFSSVVLGQKETTIVFCTRSRPK